MLHTLEDLRPNIRRLRIHHFPVPYYFNRRSRLKRNRWSSYFNYVLITSKSLTTKVIPTLCKLTQFTLEICKRCGTLLSTYASNYDNFYGQKPKYTSAISVDWYWQTWWIWNDGFWRNHCISQIITTKLLLDCVLIRLQRLQQEI